MIAWVALAAVFALVLVPFNIPRIVNILRYEASVTGTVTGIDCGNHQTVSYSFEFGGKTYEGSEQGGPCESVKAGSPITVYFSTVSPENNETIEPVGNLWNESIFVALVCLIVPTFILWRPYRSWGRRGSDERES